MPNRVITNQEWGKIIANAWLDKDFARLLTADPTAAVRQFLRLDKDVTADIFPVPNRPKDLTEEQIKAIREGRATYVLAYCC